MPSKKKAVKKAVKKPVKKVAVEYHVVEVRLKSYLVLDGEIMDGTTDTEDVSTIVASTELKNAREIFDELEEKGGQIDLYPDDQETTNKWIVLNEGDEPDKPGEDN